MNIHQSVKERLSLSKTTLVLDHVFFGHLCSKLDFVKDTKGLAQGTMATNGRVIFYDQKFVEGLSDGELLGVTAHEVLHPALQHHTRRGNRDPDVWNDSCDYAENPILIEAGFTLPQGGLINPAYKGMTAEQIYDIEIKKQKPPPQGGEKGKDESDGGDDKQDGDDEEEEKDGDQDGDGDGDEGDEEEDGQGDGDGEGDSDEEGDGEGEGEGSGQGEGKPTPRAGRVLDAPDPAQDEAEWTVNLQQATKVAQMMGNLPGGLKDAIDQVLKPRVDWRSILRRFLQQQAAADYSWTRPNKRYVRGGMYLPEIRSEDMPPIVVYWDSSGSTYGVRDVFFAELREMIEEVRPECTYLIMVDSVVQPEGVRKFERGEPMEPFDIHGMGGTSFVPGFEYVEKEGIQPACAIYLTDAYGDYPDIPPDYPVLWAITTPIEQIQNTPYYPPFGEVVPIEEYNT